MYLDVSICAGVEECTCVQHVKARCQPQVPNLRSCPSCFLVVFCSFDWFLFSFCFVLFWIQNLRFSVRPRLAGHQHPRILQCWNYKPMIPGFSCRCRELCRSMFNCCDETPWPYQLTERSLISSHGSWGIKVIIITMGKHGSRQAWGLEQQAEVHVKHKHAAERVSSKQVSV